VFTVGKLSDVAAAGNHRALLEELRNRLAAGIEEADPNVVPQYAGQLRAVIATLVEMDKVGPKEASDGTDEIAARRARRRAEAVERRGASRTANRKNSRAGLPPGP
jgi:plasmid stabilization system protein ParE